MAKNNATAENVNTTAFPENANPTTTKPREVIFISKMSVKAVKANPRDVFKTPEKPYPLMRVYGYASGIKVVENKNDGTIHEALTGEFEAENVATGDLYRSGVLYLPKGIHESIVAAVKKIEEESGNIAFALEIRSVKADNPIGYSYEGKSLIAAASVDPLESLRNQTQKLLTA